MRKQYKYIKPILRFDLNGNLISKYITSDIFDSEFYNRDSIYQAMYKNKKYRDSIWIREESYTDEKLIATINKINKNNSKSKSKGVPVLAFDTSGNFIKRYNKMSDVVLDGFNENVSSVCKNYKSKTHGGLIWIKESDYSEEELKRRVDSLKQRRFTKWANVIIGRYTTDDIFIDKGSILDFTDKGFTKDGLYGVLNGKFKTHKGFVFKVLS